MREAASSTKQEETMQSFDVVVIGSGFGGAVTAYRVASAGYSVCVLERGRAYPPGSFARSPYTVHRAFWDPDSGYTGLFDVWSFRHMNGVVSAGLGGGSLIYANVLIRKDENWFADTGIAGAGAWPIDRATLDPHYDDVE
jgi:cholesterol oxidase